MAEKVSVITISYNSKETIERTFQSIMAQPYRPLEYVLVDGASTDGTIEVIERYIPQFKALGIEVLFRSEEDKGISDAFNKGIRRSTGSIIGIINSDDQLAEDAVSRIVNKFEEDTDVVCGDCLWIDEERNLQYVRKSKMNLDLLKYEMVLMHPTCFVKKSSYSKYGMFDLNMKYVMDKDLMARFYRSGAKFKYLPQIVTKMYAGGVSDANAKKVFAEGIEIAIRNDVPKWKVVLHYQYKWIRLKMVNYIKSNKMFWKMIKREKKIKYRL